MGLSIGTGMAISAGISAVGGLLGGAMGGGGGSTTSDSTNHQYSWMAQYVNPIIEDYINSGGSQIDWINQQVAGLTPGEQEALNYMSSGAMQKNGQALAGKGASLAKGGMQAYYDLLTGGTRYNKANFISDVQSGMGLAQQYIDQATKSATDSILVDYGNDAAQNTTNSMIGGTYTSGMANSQTAMAVGADESIESTAANINANALRDVTRGVSNAFGTGINLYTNGARGALNTGEKMAQAGGKMTSQGWQNEMNAGLFEQYYNQQVMNNNRYNGMMSGNMGIIDAMISSKMILPYMNDDRTSQTHTESSTSGGGLF